MSDIKFSRSNDYSSCDDCLELANLLHGEWGATRKHKNSWNLLLDSSASCSLCALIVEAFDRSNILTTWSSPRQLVGNSVIEATVYGDKIRLRCHADDDIRSSFSSDLLFQSIEEADLQHYSHRNDFQNRMKVARTWLSECLSAHSGCQGNGSHTRPTRLIYVGDHSGKLRVIQTSTTQHETSYTTLSHCWGPPPHPIKLTKSNIQELEAGMPLQTLPPTFEDAVHITRALGLDYLWIDSLCIVQDDPADWAREAARMAAVYKNSFLTIAATASHGPHGGCFQHDSKATIVDFKSCTEEMSTASELYHCSIAFDSTRSLTLSPLNSRAWVKQEMTLSRRVLHCCKDQLVWQCFAYIESEDGTHFLERNFDRTERIDFSDHFQSLNTWWDWVDDYRGRALTDSADMLAAFAGITAHFKDRAIRSIGHNVMGIWSNDLPCGLLWGTQRGDGRPSNLKGAPTWSWISSVGDIKKPKFYERRGYSRYRQLAVAKVIGTDINWAGVPLTSSIQRAELFVAARLQVVRVGEDITSHGVLDGDRRNHYIHGDWGRELFPIPTDRDTGVTHFNLPIGLLCDDGSRPAPGTILTCLQIAVSYVDEAINEDYQPDQIEDLEQCERDYVTKAEAYHHFLALQATDKERVYKRIGIGYVILKREDASWHGFRDSVGRCHVYLV